MLTLYLLCGPPGSGKSRTAKEYEKSKNIPVISRDAVRAELKAKNPNVPENAIWQEVLKRAQAALEQGYDTLIDATFSNPKRRKSAVAMARTLGSGISIIALVMNTPLPKCLEQNRLRKGDARIPDKDVERLYRDFWSQPPQPGVDGIDVVRHLMQ
ncbi:MAG TPA: ATP-binding protein [Candidatus Saccharimonadales bacterium]|nr:ATP-binding protein [Candidatus Saccharimonadales bacterium]